MMEKIRTAGNSTIVKVIFGLIIIAFIFTGFGNFLQFGFNSSNDRNLYIAKVNGEGISREVYEKELQMVLKDAKNLKPDDPLLEEVSKSVLSNIINDVLSYEFANSLSLNITDEQIKNVIRQQKIFFENNHFSNQRYLQLLAENNLTPDVYATGYRTEMKKSQLINGLITTNFVVPKDSEISALINQTRTIYLTDYSLSNLKEDFSVSDQDIENFYNIHKQSYTHPARLKMKYLINPYPEIERDITISQNDIQEYYNEGKPGTMSLPKQSYSILSFNSLAKAQASYQSLMAMPTPKRLAVKMDHLGWFSSEQSVNELLQNQKLTKVGSISKPIKQANSYYIIRLDEIQVAKKLPYDYVKANIESVLKKEQADKIYNEQQIRLEKAAKLPTLEEISRASGFHINESEWTTENEIYSIGRFQTIRNIIFSDLMIKDGKPTNAISDIIYAPEYQSSFIVQVTDYQDAGIKPFDEVKNQIKDFLITQKKKEHFSEAVDTIVTQMNNENSNGDIAFAQRVTLKRTNNESNLLDQSSVDKIFSMVPNAKTGRIFGGSIETPTNAKLYVLINVKDGEVADLSKPLQLDYTTINYDYVLDELRSNAKIELLSQK